MPKLTALAADKLTVKSGRKDFFDPSYPGLALRVSATGRKAWVYFYRIKNGKVHQRRLTLGTYPAMDVGAAHDAWRRRSTLCKPDAIPPSPTRSYPQCHSRASLRNGSSAIRPATTRIRASRPVPQLRPAGVAGAPHHRH